MPPATLDDFYVIIREAKPSDGGRVFDLAFGVSPGVIPFALSFGLDRLTLPWLFWPDWLNPANDPAAFKGTFDSTLSSYFAEIATGRLKFNLSGLNDSHPNSLTSWELQQLSTTYSTRTDYFSPEQGSYRLLSEDEAHKRIVEILG